MDVTSDEIRSSRFQGTRHVYDRREVDAFLHRTAATLEVYERKIAVTQAHVESLEKALDLAHGRARAIRSRETRISELESALAAAQHNYESAMAILEARSDAPELPDVDDHELVRAARTRVEEILKGALEEAALIRGEGEAMAEQAAAAAAQTRAAAEAEAEELRTEASLEHAAMLEEVAQARRDAKAALEEELDSKRSTVQAELEAEKLRLAAETEAARANIESRFAEGEHMEAEPHQELLERLEAAEKRAAAAEAERSRLLAEVERAAAAAEAERRVFMEDAERMFEEAVARAEAERGSAAAQPAAEVGADAEVVQLRRQVAQLRTALSGLQRRFSDISDLSVEEIELSAMLAGLEAGEDDVIDLTAPALAADDAGASEGPGGSVTVKSKWAETQPMHAAPRADIETVTAEDGRHGAPHPGRTWRDDVGATPKKHLEEAANSEDDAVIGFYERRLAGLRARLKDAAPRDA